jgi:hypothetical protein
MHLRYESPLRLARLLKVEGFGKLQIYWLPILPSRWHRLQRLIESRILVWVLRFVPFLGMLVSHAFIVRAQKLSAPQASRSRA